MYIFTYYVHLCISHKHTSYDLIDRIYVSVRHIRCSKNDQQQLVVVSI